MDYDRTLSPTSALMADESDLFNADEAKDNITDLLTQIEGHDMWIQEQCSSTETRLKAYQQAMKQGGRLRQMLEAQSSETPSQQQYELILTLKSDFLKAISRIQDDLVSSHSANGQSLEHSKQRIHSLEQQISEMEYKSQQQGIQCEQYEHQIEQLRVENERLQRLKDLLMQQQDAMNQRLSQQKGKDQAIADLTASNDELSHKVEVLTQENNQKETLNNNFKLQIASIGASCKQLMEENESLKAAKQEIEHQLDELKQQEMNLQKSVDDQVQQQNEQKLNVDTVDKSEYDVLQLSFNELQDQHRALQDTVHEMEQRLQSQSEQIEQNAVNVEETTMNGDDDNVQKEEFEELKLRAAADGEEIETLKQQMTEMNEEATAQIDALNTEKQKLQSQFTVLLREKSDLSNKYNALTEKHEKLTNISTQTTERNLTFSAENEALKETVATLRVQVETLGRTKVDEDEERNMLNSKIEALSDQINSKNQQIADQRSKAEEMHNQREDLQRKLQESQAVQLEIETKCQDLEARLMIARTMSSNLPIYSNSTSINKSTLNGSSPKTPIPMDVPNERSLKRIRSDATISMEDLSVFFNLNNRLQPIDAMIKDFVSKWQFNSQVFRMEEEEIRENERESTGTDRYKQWMTFESILEGVKEEIGTMKVELNGNGNGKGSEDGESIKFRELMMELILQKIGMIKHVGTVHMKRGQKMSQIMYLAQQRIVSLQKDLTKKNREMEIHLKVKEKMYDEVKSVQQKVENLSREYQIVVRELENLREGRADSIDSSFSH